MWGRDRVQSECLAPGRRVCVQNTQKDQDQGRGHDGLGFLGFPAPPPPPLFFFKYLPCVKNFTFMRILTAACEAKITVPFCC